jgi:hypothetical protein
VNRSKRLYLLAGILVAVSLATFLVFRLEQRQEQIKNSGETILAVPADGVESLSWTYEDTTLAFHRADGTWVYDGDAAFPVDDATINDMLSRFEDFAAAFVIEDVEDFGQYGLDDPTATIGFATADASYEVTLGNFSTLDAQRYVSIGDGNVYLVADDPLDDFDATLSDVIDHDETPAFESVSRIEFAGAESYTVTYEADSPDTYCSDDVYFAQLGGAARPLDTGRVDTYLGTLSYLSPTDYVTYKAADADLAEYGLDAPELTVTVDYTTTTDAGDVAGTFVLAVSRDPAERATAEAAASASPEVAATAAAATASAEAEAEDDVTAYVRIGDSPIVYRITAAQYTALMAAGYDSLRHLDLFCGDFADVEGIDIALEDADYTVTSEAADDTRTYSFNGEEVDLTEFRTALAGLNAVTFTEEKPTEKEEIGLVLHLDNAHRSEVTLDLYRYDGTHCLAVVDGEPVALVERAAVVDLIESVHAIVLN